MTVTGIIAEYNPFHSGHRYHIQRTKEELDSDFIVVLMSGSFVQRGEPAIIDKFSRARTALQEGADLVLEMPTVFSLQSAEGFARGCVKIFQSLNCIDFLSFGLEDLSLSDLLPISKLLLHSQESLDDILYSFIREGYSYPVAYQRALSVLCDRHSLNPPTSLWRSNNLLGLEYTKALLRIRSSIRPFALQRRGNDYRSEIFQPGNFQSAQALRKEIKRGPIMTLTKYLPESSLQALEKFYALYNSWGDIDNYASVFRYLIQIQKKDLSDVVQYEPGLQNLFLKHLSQHDKLSDILHACTSKRYKKSRLQRFVFNALLHITPEDLSAASRIGYVRPLAFNDKGRYLIRKIRQQSSMHLPVKFADQKQLSDQDKRILSLDARGTDLFFLPFSRQINLDYRHNPYCP